MNVEDWLTSDEVARLLGIHQNNVGKFCCNATVRHLAAPHNWRIVYHRDDIEALARVRREARLSLRAAVRVLDAERSGAIP